MKTTIIKILNQIANGEQPPKKILVNDNIYVWEEDGEYVNVDDELDLLFDFESYCQLQECLNMEVTILETTTLVVDKVNEDGSIYLKQDNDYQYQPYTGEAEIKCNSPKNILESNKIEKLYLENIHTTDTFNLCEHTNEQFEEVNNKINEIIDRVNNER